MSELVVRPYRETDAPTFKALNVEWIAHYFKVEPKDLEALDHPEAILDGGAIVMAELGGECVGTCALIRRPEPDTWEVAKMGVRPAQRGAGVGSALLAAVVKTGRALGAKRLYIETNSSLAPAIALYEKFGFRHLADDEHPPSPYIRADVFMALDLQ